MDLEHERRLTEVESKAERNEGRIKKLENEQSALHDLAKSMAVMAEKQEQVADTVDKLDGKVTALEEKPAKRWDGLVDKIIWAVAAAMIGFALAKIGL